MYYTITTGLTLGFQGHHVPPSSVLRYPSHHGGTPNSGPYATLTIQQACRIALSFQGSGYARATGKHRSDRQLEMRRGAIHLSRKMMIRPTKGAEQSAPQIQSRTRAEYVGGALLVSVRSRDSSFVGVGASDSNMVIVDPEQALSIRLIIRL